MKVVTEHALEAEGEKEDIHIPQDPSLVTDPTHPQPWRYVTVAELEHLTVRVTEQPPGCLCPECNAT